jgi:hypothetical protein
MSETGTTPPEGQATADSALVDAFLQYRDAGLRVPAVPRELADRLEELADWQYGTEPVDLTDRAGFLAAAASPTTPASVAFGHAGHGVASWFLCYRLIRGPLAVFIRQRFGSPYDDTETSRIVVNSTLASIELLVVSAERALATGRLRAGRRLAMLVDEVGGSGWELLGGEGGWQASDSAIAGAMDFLVMKTDAQ